MATKAKQSKSAPAREESHWPFGTRNYIVMAIALIVITIGYVTLGEGSITLAPLLLVIGYCVLIPAALLIKDPAHQRRQEAEAAQPTEQQ